MRRVDSGSRVVSGLAAAVLAAAVAAGCGGGGSESVATTVAPASSVPTTTLPTESAVANADGEITTALGTFPLRVLDCRLDDGGAVFVVAETEDGAARLELDGVAAATNIEFVVDHGDGDPVVWTVAGAGTEVDGSALSYRGPSQVGGQEMAETTIALRISC